MAARRKQRSFPAFLSVLGHAALVALLFYGVPLARTERTAISDGNPVNTIMVSEIPYVVERQRMEAELEAAREREAAEAADAQRRAREAAEQADREARLEQQRIAAEEAAAAEADRIRLQREAEEKQKQLDEERIAAEKAAEEQRQREQAERLAAEQAAEEERQREAEAERQRQAEAARQRQIDQIAAEIAAVAAAEEADRMARESGLLDQWIRAIEARVTSRWIEPPNRSPNLDCMLDVDLQPDGSVTNVRVSQCSNADDNVIRSLDNAVRQSSPLPRRPEGLAYQPSLSIRFRPND